MTKLIRIFKLEFNILISPVRAIKGDELITYDRNAFLLLFTILSSLSFLITYLLSAARIQIAFVIASVLLGPMIIFLVFYVGTLPIFLFFKLIGKSVAISFSKFKVLLYPVFLLFFMFYSVAVYIAYFHYFSGILLRDILYGWLYLLMFIMLRYKFSQSIVRSLLIALVALLVYLIPIFIQHFM